MATKGAHQRITEILQDYWLRKRDGDAVPYDGDIDPGELGAVWDHCFLVQRKADGHFEYLHMGDAIIKAYGDDMTGYEVCEKLIGKLHKPLASKFEKTLAGGQPVINEASFINSHKMEIKFRACLLPLRRWDEKIAYVLGGMKWKAC